MDKIVIADKYQHARLIRALFHEYLTWAAAIVLQEYHMDYSVENAVEQDMVDLDKFMPPKGRLLLALEEEKAFGIACMRELAGDTGEIKRMYVRPEFRGRGTGRALLEKLIDEAIKIGYLRLRLDSARFMKEAHQLYRTMGFIEIGPYEGSEIPVEYQSKWIFMERQLTSPSKQDRP